MTTWQDQIHFGDPRPPHEIKAKFERDLVALFRPDPEASKLTFRASPEVTGVAYNFELRFEAALPTINCYTLHVDADWSATAAKYHDYYQKTSVSWFKHWTRDFKPTKLPHPAANVPERYKMLVGQSLSAESNLVDVEAIQQTILAAMRKGATFSTAHKEGGTRLSFTGSHFFRADYGESEETETFAGEATFLAYLRKFNQWKTSGASEYDAWKLILRQIN
jgi:hypothetical protein